MFERVHPIIGTRDIERAIAFYTEKLGFALAFRDAGEPPSYVGFRRDAVELHVQFQFEHEMGTIRLRYTPRATRELALWDPDRNALTFYRDLRADEKAPRA